MNNILKTRDEITQSTEWLKSHNLITHPISCKDWELAAVLKHNVGGDILDMGADGSFVLHNVVKQHLKGRKTGIDLAEVTGDNRAEGAAYYKGDLMNAPFEDNSFDMITCMSVIEHDVNFTAFVKEVYRLLRSNGKLFVSFDYWPEKVNTTGLLLYGLQWNILDRKEAGAFIQTCEYFGLQLSSTVDWETKDAVINPSYCSPFPGISYTFSILSFIKK